MNETETIADVEFAKAVEEIKDAGKDAGRAAGGWIADGNTTEEELRNVLQMWDDCDPAAPYAPSPFSGEWAGDPSLQSVIEDATGLTECTPEEEDELASAFEEAFAEAWQDEAERTVRAFLGE